MQDPFGDPLPASAANKNYLMLVSVSKDNAKAIQNVLTNLKETVDKNAWPLWVDSKGLGVFIKTDLVAGEIRHAAFQGVAGDFTDIKDALVVEVGPDWYASDDSPMKNWLTAHVGAPSVPPLDSRLKRRKGGPKRA
ncbi:MAG: hypothetical protein ACTS5Y_01275 [Pollutimonas bauzanensis]|uniref:Uncharacterized protein n=1 Tax=Pollutimonas bauzanensis TaxID=658167 RepID=A0A1M5ZWQ9_9BURK|nr:hypothetical protein [Pollutimonas bauzanensis]SHI28694.1 hypothetical protein SAMN04488135_1205 [Pollutimonas bauzanensis]